jgi:hypothetical protein
VFTAVISYLSTKKNQKEEISVQVFVADATGFFGQAIARELFKRGWHTAAPV